MIQRNRDYLIENGGMPSAVMLQSVIAEHLAGMPRLEKLRRYYDGKNDILSRVRKPWQPNNRIAHPFGRYIATITSGYLIGQPAAYRMSNSAHNETLDRILDLYERESISAVDMENARNAAIFGRGVEYIHTDASETDVMPHVTALSPTDAFVVYDDTYDMRPLFGVYFAPKTKENGKNDGFRVWVIGDRKITQLYTKDIESAEFETVEEKEHFFGGVPLVEYWNDENERGDFEWVITQIDAYDKLESDRVNDKEQYVDKLIVLTGCVLETDSDGRSPGQQLREDKLLALPDSSATVNYLQSSLDEANVEVQRQALEDDIHKLSMVPNLADKEFAANASGVAMRYKLMGLTQLTRIKERWFVEGLRSRIMLYANFMEVKGLPALDVSSVSISLTHAMPADRMKLANIANTAKAANAASIRQRVSILHDGEGWKDSDVDDEVARILQENGDPLGQFGNIIPGDNTVQLKQQDRMMGNG